MYGSNKLNLALDYKENTLLDECSDVELQGCMGQACP